MQNKHDKDSLEISKVKDIEETLVQHRTFLDRLQQETEYNQSHYMMIENYMEKYLPIIM